MPRKINTSVNIVRDINAEIDYLPTPNGVKTISLISNDFKKGLRSFNIIGSYGTGKSSFLWAFQKSLTNEKSFFNLNILNNPKTEIINVVGEYGSLYEKLCDELEILSKNRSVKYLLNSLKLKYNAIKGKDRLLVILIDEFGKFLEFAAKNNSEKELYFIQQLTEFVNNQDLNIILVTTVHQNFEEYAYSVSASQKNEWIKIKGRFREITFNEPVDQLLYLASKRLKSSSNINNKDLDYLNDLMIKSKCFQINSQFLVEISVNLFPLDIFSANIITAALQKYGQNERSLFSFLESTDEFGIQGFKSKNTGFYNLSFVYDYLYFNFYSFINSKYNPDFSNWKSIQNTIEKIDNLFIEENTKLKSIIKIIGLFNIFCQNNFSLGKDLIINYANKTLGINDSKKLIEKLVAKKIIIYREYNKRYILFEGTDLDIQTALLEAGQKASQITDLSTLLNKYYQLPSIVAKEETYKKGTPRLFEYRITNQPLKETPINEIDGFINLIFNDKISKEAVRDFSEKNKDSILYGYFKNSIKIKDILFEIEKINKVKSENLDDKIAVKELTSLYNHHINELNDIILNHHNTKLNSIIWYYNGEEIKLENKKKFNKQLSIICNKVYSKTPIFNNELVNKHKISPTIHTAKRNFFKSVVNNWDKVDLNFPDDKFPPEKTIYLTLFKNNGIDLNTDVSIINDTISKKNKIHYVWDVSCNFFDGCKISKRKVSELYTLLSHKPYKLKQGFLDFWIPSFLFIQRNEFALFNENGYIPNINEEVIELIGKYPEKFEIKTFDIDGVKLDIFNSYRSFLNQEDKVKFTNTTFIQTIKPFLTFYKNLPEYAKNTKRLSFEATSIRTSIANSKDPEKTFFEDFPSSLGFDLLKIKNNKKELHAYTVKLEESIREIRSCYDNLVTRFETFFNKEITQVDVDFIKYKKIIQIRYKNIKRHLLLPPQRNLLQRIDSEINDKIIWINSIVQCLHGVPLDKIKDEDENAIYDKLLKAFNELDDLLELSTTSFDENNETNISISINTLGQESKKRIIRIPKKKEKSINELENKIISILSKDENINMIVLSKILKEKLI
jgi:dsDNA-binding SOS-regulon protein